MILKDDIKMVCSILLEVHLGLQRFVTATAKVEPCDCPVCQAARRVLNEIEKEAK